MYIISNRCFNSKETETKMNKLQLKFTFKTVPSFSSWKSQLNRLDFIIKSKSLFTHLFVVLCCVSCILLCVWMWVAYIWFLHKPKTNQMTMCFYILAFNYLCCKCLSSDYWSVTFYGRVKMWLYACFIMSSLFLSIINTYQLIDHNIRLEW